MLFASVLVASALVASAAAADFRVNVGKDTKLLFDPEFVNAEPGDTVTFVFYPKNHTVTQSTFKDPCTPVDGGFDSGFVAYPPDATPDKLQTYQITVEDKKPKWAFCAQVKPAPHCHKGMVFSVNPDAGKKDDGSPTSADGYKQLAVDLAKNDPIPSSAASASPSATDSTSASATDDASSSDGASSTDASASASPTGSASDGASTSASASASNGASASGSTSATSALTTGASAVKPVTSTTDAPATVAASASPLPTTASNAASPLTRNAGSALAAAAVILGFVL